MSREFIAHSTKMLHFSARLSISVSSHHDLSLAAFITNMAESDFRYAQLSHHGLSSVVFIINIAESDFRHTQWVDPTSAAPIAILMM
jgi:hypothetical protein